MDLQQAGYTRPLQRLKRRNDNQSNDNDDEDNELFTSSSNHDTSNTDGGSKTLTSTMQALFGEDDIEEEGGGFLLPSSSANDEPTTKPTASKEVISSTKMDSRENEIVLLDDDMDDSSVEVVGKDGSAVENSKDDTYENHTAQASNTKNSTLPSSKLLELSTAEEEWEQWGDEEAADVNVAVQSKSIVPPRTNSNMAMDDSDSDDDEGQDNTFLTLGQATKRVHKEVGGSRWK